MSKKNKKIKDYFDISKTSYLVLLKSSGKWKELFIEKEAIISIIIAAVATSSLVIFYGDSIDMSFNEIIKNISLEISMALIGLLGFTISGLAIFTGTITNKLVKSIDDDNKGEAIINILYSFYFIGGIDACEIFALLIVYFLSYTDIPFIVIPTYIAFFIIEYLFNFIILYSVSLLGTCINLFLVSYKYFLQISEKKEDKEKK